MNKITINDFKVIKINNHCKISKYMKNYSDSIIELKTLVKEYEKIKSSLRQILKYDNQLKSYKNSFDKNSYKLSPRLMEYSKLRKSYNDRCAIYKKKIKEAQNNIELNYNLVLLRLGYIKMFKFKDNTYIKED